MGRVPYLPVSTAFKVFQIFRVLHGGMLILTSHCYRFLLMMSRKSCSILTGLHSPSSYHKFRERAEGKRTSSSEVVFSFASDNEEYGMSFTSFWLIPGIRPSQLTSEILLPKSWAYHIWTRLCYHGYYI